MKTYFITIFFLAIISISAQNSGVLKFENTTLNYGTLNLGDDAKSDFNFTNTGTTPVIIENVKSNSRNISFEIKDTLIKSGEKGQITVIYYAEKAGPIRKTITVFANANVYTLTLKGEVLSKE